MDIDTKECIRCKESKTLDSFKKQSQATDGRYRMCTSCLDYKNTNKAIGKKECTLCKKVKEEKDFGYVRKSTNTLNSRCKECCNRLRSERGYKGKKDTEYSKKNKKLKRKDLKRNYNLSLEDYNIMLEAQGNICKICSMPETYIEYRSGEVRELSVDHCHETKKIRGLLCNRCNFILGASKDNIKILELCINYLKETDTVKVCFVQ